MKLRFTALLLVLFQAFLVMPAYALENYLQDTADAGVLVEVQMPEGVVPPTFWDKVKSYLGIRKQSRAYPPVGTVFTVQSSAYASSPYQTDSTPCVTAAGTRVRPGVVASNFLPIGTILDINGEEYIVEDRMNSRYNGYFIDLWFPSTSSALEFGRKSMTVTVKAYGEAGDPIREEAAKAAQAQAENEAVVLADDATEESVWVRIAQTFTNLRGYLGAKVSPSVNRFDVDCLGDEQ